MGSLNTIQVPAFFLEEPGWHHVEFRWVDGQRTYYLDGSWIPTVFVDMELEADRYARRSLPAPPPEKPDTATPTEPE